MAITREAPRQEGLGNLDIVALVWASWGDLDDSQEYLAYVGVKGYCGIKLDRPPAGTELMDEGDRQELGENSQGQWDGGKGGFYQRCLQPRPEEEEGC